MEFLGIILAGIFGLLFGNYSTTVFYRLPIGKPINGITDKIGIKPHCSKCGHKLKFYEYLPLLSWVSTRFKCNYCGAKTDMMYTFLEASALLASIFLYLILGFSNEYIFSLLSYVLLMLSLCLYIRHKKVYKSVSVMLLAIIVITIVAT